MPPSAQPWPPAWMTQGSCHTSPVFAHHLGACTARQVLSPGQRRCAQWPAAGEVQPCSRKQEWGNARPSRPAGLLPWGKDTHAGLRPDEPRSSAPPHQGRSVPARGCLLLLTGQGPRLPVGLMEGCQAGPRDQQVRPLLQGQGPGQSLCGCVVSAAGGQGAGGICTTLTKTVPILPSKLLPSALRATGSHWE